MGDHEIKKHENNRIINRPREWRKYPEVEIQDCYTTDQIYRADELKGRYPIHQSEFKVTEKSEELKLLSTIDRQDILWMEKYGEYLIVLNSQSEIEKLDRSFQVVQKIEIPNCARNNSMILLNRNYLLFTMPNPDYIPYNVFVKLDLNTFTLQSSYECFSHSGRHGLQFAIHKKNNCIYYAYSECKSKEWYVYLDVLNIKTLNIIKIVRFIDPKRYLKQLVIIDLAIRDDKLVINAEFDYAGGCSILLVCHGIDKKQFPKSFQVVPFYRFIDEQFLLGNKNDHLYLKSRCGFVFDLNKDKISFIKNDHLGYVGNKYFATQFRLFIHQNHLFQIRNGKLFIIDLKKFPYLNVARYEINFTSNIRRSFMGHVQVGVVCFDQNLMYVQTNDEGLQIYEIPTLSE